MSWLLEQHGILLVGSCILNAKSASTHNIKSNNDKTNVINEHNYYIYLKSPSHHWIPINSNGKHNSSTGTATRYFIHT